MKLNLETKNKEQELIKAYLEENASETLAEKINNGVPAEKDGKRLINRKTLDGFMKYACDEARKQAEKGTNSACIQDSVVFGWAVHYLRRTAFKARFTAKTVRSISLKYWSKQSRRSLLPRPNRSPNRKCPYSILCRNSQQRKKNRNPNSSMTKTSCLRKKNNAKYLRSLQRKKNGKTVSRN